MQISEIPEGRYCTDGLTFRCKFFEPQEGDWEIEWCEMYECHIEDYRKCAPCAHPEI